MTDDRKELMRLLSEQFPIHEGGLVAQDMADAILAAGFTRADATTEYAISWVGTDGQPITDAGSSIADVEELVRQQEPYAIGVQRQVGPWIPIDSEARL